ncbi:MAG TPA: TniQ family protein [Actinomycetes bacterium]|nr:TniQ family protein [Actinomycetes bacterium]
MSPRAIPEVLRPLPIRVRPKPAETVASYVVRLARANHLQPRYLHAYLCGPPDWHGAADLERLAVLCGRPLAVLQRALTGPTSDPQPTPEPPRTLTGPATRGRPAHPGRVVDRKVSSKGMISYAGGHYSVAAALAGQLVQVTCTDSIVQIFQGGQLLRTWPRRPSAHQAPSGVVVDRRVWSSGAIGYAGASYSVAAALAGQLVQVTCTDSEVEIFQSGRLLRTWPRRHPPAKQASTRRPSGAGTPPARLSGQPTPTAMAIPNAQTGRVVNRKVWSTGVIGYAGASYSVGRPFAGQLVQVTVDDGTVQIFQSGQLLRTWPRRHPPAKEASIQPDRSNQPSQITPDQAHRLAPLDDLDTDPRVVHRLVDPNGALSFAGCYYLAGRYLVGHVVQVRCASGIVQIIHGGELVRAWQQRHTPEQEQRMLRRPNLQQRIANARSLNGSRQQRPGPARQP